MEYTVAVVTESFNLPKYPTLPSTLTSVKLFCLKYYLVYHKFYIE